MSAILRDTPFGQALRYFTGDSILKYPEEEPNFDVSKHLRNTAPSGAVSTNQSQIDLDQEDLEKDPTDVEKGSNIDDVLPDSTAVASAHHHHDGESLKADTVTWYSDTDPENPQNWTTQRKASSFLLICLLTFAIYSCSSIITPAEFTFRTQWGVSPQASLLVLSMYVLGYGCGPMIFAPLSEVPMLGRNTPYIVSFAMFFIMTIPCATVTNYPGLVVCRFFQGFFGGPVLATGGASAGDIFHFWAVPYGMAMWACAGYSGPALGPVMSVFAIEERTWRWSMYETLIISGVTFILMFFLLPETNPETILLRRAQRLRRITGRDDLLSETEKRDGHLTWQLISNKYIIMPFKIPLLDPAIGFIHLYIGLIYGIYYSFFEAFPVAYLEVYGFSIQSMSIVFLTIGIGAALAAFLYIALVYFIYEPYTKKNGIGHPEYRLVPGLVSASLLPIGLFLFGWTARPGINWAVPTLGVLIFASTSFVLIQVIFVYLPTSYPRYAASIFAGNNLLRSVIACCAIHWSLPLYANLGIGRGVSVVGGICAGCLIPLVALWHYGPTLRAKSRFADTY
ncbi:hypothetical protein BAUCODRAFT_120350 [Baudoinia panamericana UAMH 10762]|uniref:Major facilitator superfamily (MFS) profile domain-containing protein n=1 Tax=Baudoinia panamericana (strain UAMH 10762) TaxID=717646 RepID=M2LWM4_BAUPA|nr:uncharacterized protein BAUCODRAFT_120350 [Baudoinia panamericana UAMH 10762]EMC99057.1 hypothetical protein BAUCODRAFT_120350 [Baudoinia panamericana UAMH 10762]